MDYDTNAEGGPDQAPLRYCEFMVVRNISQAKAQLSALIEEVQKGNEVILGKAAAVNAVAGKYPVPAQSILLLVGDLSKIAAGYTKWPRAR